MERNPFEHMEKNPYALPNGAPMPGKFGQWLEHRNKAYQAYLDSLTPEQREKVEERKRQMSRRMASEVGHLS